MNKKHGNLLFCLLFALICILPLMGMLVFGPSKAGANEVLANKPTLLKKDGSVNVGYLSDLSEYVRDRFGFRQELITANAKLTAAVFDESATEKVILGENGWLYYADTLADFEGTAPMSERQIWNAAHTLALMEEYAASQGVEFLFAAAPNKNTLYPQWMPYEQSDAVSNLQRLHRELAAEGTAFCDLLSVLSARAEPVYHKTDSHWDHFGSALAHDALMEALGKETALSQENFLDAPHRGDLTDMLYPASKETELGPVLSRERTFTYKGNVRGPDDMTIRTTSETGSGSLLMFRDSFGNTLHADLAESFSTACFSRAMPYDLTLVEKEQADTLIIEIVERNLVWLAQKAPVMAAPVRELELPTETAAGSAVWEAEDSKLENCKKYTGEVRCEEMDADSPIYVVLDGVVYEATPAGESDASFTLHAPEAETVTVLVQCGGQWKQING